MPGAVPRTSTYALANATLPYLQNLASGVLDAVRNDPSLAKGVNVHGGKVTYEAVAQTFDLDYTPLESVL
jgi:alanine dehydrogenase